MAEMSLASKLKALRTARGISQEDLARAVGVTSQSISRIERGQTKVVKVSNLMRIAAFFGIEDPTDLLDADNVAELKASQFLTLDEITTLLTELRATPIEKAWVFAFLESPEGKPQTFTRNAMSIFLDEIRAARDRGLRGHDAAMVALEALENELAAQESLTSGGRVSTLPPPDKR